MPDTSASQDHGALTSPRARSKIVLRPMHSPSNSLYHTRIQLPTHPPPKYSLTPTPLTTPTAAMRMSHSKLRSEMGRTGWWLPKTGRAVVKWVKGVKRYKPLGITGM